MTDRGAIPLRPGKPNRAAEPAAIEAWTTAAGIPTVGRIEAPGTVEGGDTFWLRPDLLCIGRTLRTNAEGARQLAALVGGDVRIFDVPYWRGPAELIHLLSVISPVADDLAVVYLPLLPVGLWALLGELGIRLIEVPDEEFPTLGCNVLAVRARGRHRGRGEPADGRGARGRRLRGPHLPRDRDRDQRLRRADLHDPADPAWLTAAPAIDRDRLVADLTALVRIPSVTGSEEAVAAWAAGALRELGLRVEVVAPSLERDPRRPGLAGRGDAADGAAGRDRAGRARRRTAARPVGAPRCRPAGRPGHLDGRPVGRRDPRRRAVRPRRLRHEGRRGVDPGGGPGARRRPATSTGSAAS